MMRFLMTGNLQKTSKNILLLITKGDCGEEMISNKRNG